MNGKDNERSDKEELPEAIELTQGEKTAFETLPRNRIPRAALEDRVVGALRNRGFLPQRRRRVVELTAWRVAAAAAACLALSFGGFALGQRVGSHRAEADELAVPEISDISVAATLQQAGSAYVMALQRFSALPDSVDGDQAVQGREVALTTLYTAADKVSRLVPKEELARQLLAAIDTGPAGGTPGEGGDAGGGTRVIEF